MISSKYLAGFIDGEGTITARQMGHHLAISVIIGNTNEQIIRLLQKKFGGYITVRTYDNPAWKTLYSWKVESRKAVKVLHHLRRYLIIKKPQAELALQLASMMSGPRGRLAILKDERILRQEIREQLTQLNRRGRC